jgi:hypothetical protein
MVQNFLTLEKYHHLKKDCISWSLFIVVKIQNKTVEIVLQRDSKEETVIAAMISDVHLSNVCIWY